MSPVRGVDLVVRVFISYPIRGIIGLGFPSYLCPGKTGGFHGLITPNGGFIYFLH